MPSVVQSLVRRALVRPPSYVPQGMVLEVVTGSVAYGVSEDSSDFDVVGITVPSKELVFPHLSGEIIGWDKNPKRFDQYQEHHVCDPAALGGKGRNYDLTVYSIVRFFRLAADCNPNIIDVLFVPRECVLFSNPAGEIIRDNRKLFLSKAAWHRYRGYAFAQLHKARSKTPEEGSKRAEVREKYGYDVKFLMHTCRLAGYAQQILEEGDLDLRRGSEYLKAIRRGEVSFDDALAWFNDKEKQLENVYQNSSLPHGPDEAKIKSVLLACLEQHWGSLDKLIRVEGEAEAALREIARIAGRFSSS